MMVAARSGNNNILEYIGQRLASGRPVPERASESLSSNSLDAPEFALLLQHPENIGRLAAHARENDGRRGGRSPGVARARRKHAGRTMRTE